MKEFLENIERAGERKAILVLLLICAVVYSALIISNPLPDLMEARNLISARECVEDGNCFIPTLNGEYRVRKPPLPTWVTAVAMKVSGDVDNIYAARIPAILMVLLMGFFVYRFARRSFGVMESFTASLLTAVSFLMCDEARRVTWDIFAVSFSFGGLWTLYEALKSKGRAVLPWAVASALLWAFAIMSKGPLPFVAILGPYLAAIIITKRWRGLNWQAAVGIIVFAVAIGLSWWAYVYLVFPEVTLKMKYEVSSWTGRHDVALFEYMNFPLLFFPWTAAFLGSIVLVFSKGLSKATLFTKENRSELIFFLVWFAISFIVLSVAPQKKARYLMGSLLPAAMATTFFLTKARSFLDESGAKPRLLDLLAKVQLFQVPVIASGLIIVSIYAIIFMGAPKYILVFAPLLALLSYRVIKEKFSPANMLPANIVLVILMVFTIGLAAHQQISTDPKHDIRAGVRVNEITEGDRLYTYKKEDRLVWLIKRKIIPLDIRKVDWQPPAYMIVRTKDLAYYDTFLSRQGFSSKEVYRFTFRDDYILYRLDPNGIGDSSSP